MTAAAKRAAEGEGDRRRNVMKQGTGMRIRDKMRVYGLMTSGLLLVALLCGSFLFLYSVMRFDRVSGVSYLQSSILGRVVQLNSAVEEYGRYPNGNSAAEIDGEFQSIGRYLGELENRRRGMTIEQQLLLQAVSRTWDTYGDSFRRLMRLAEAEEDTPQFYVAYEESMEIGGYINTYLEQLIQETLAAGRGEYEHQIRLLRWMPLGLVVLLFLSALLNRRLQRMAAQSEKTELEKQLSAAKFTMLRNQINPHFLFNALNLISQTAYQESAGETENLIQRLSELLRYNLYHDEDWTLLQSELDVLHSYMYIQESRFGDRLIFWVECGIDAGQTMIPSFMLQPLVENAVSHGVVPKEEGGMIRVKLLQQKGWVRISVTDTGVGMEPEVLKQLQTGKYMRSRQRKRKYGGIGVENVAVRFSMLFPEGSFRILSKKGTGTCVILRFPIQYTAMDGQKEESADDSEDISCGG